MSFELGAVFPAALDVFDQNSNLVDPQSATLTITLPDGVTTVTPSISFPSPVAGQLRYQYLTTMAGRHIVRWVTVNPDTAYTDVFDVREAAPPSILSLFDVKTILEIDPTNTSMDDELRAMMFGVTAMIENYMHEVIAQRTVVENHQMDQWSWNWMSPRLRLLQVPIIQLVSLVSLPGSNTPGLTWSPANLYIDPNLGIVNVISGPPITGWVQATYIAGYQIIPYHYLEGAKVVFLHTWESRRGPGGVGGVAGPEELADYRHYTALPRKAMEWLGPPRPVVM